jgi:hypothetical protein
MHARFVPAARAAHFPNHENGKFHATFRRTVELLHPARSSSAGRAPLSFNDEHFCRRAQRPAKRGTEGALVRRIAAPKLTVTYALPEQRPVDQATDCAIGIA